ncbi:hypothetical protein C4A77_19035 [Brevibacillus laterosporus]|uniref:Uncharacterized protein n=1 Tax=Brevibacillus laterosporus TaxID=1465 RepID=A0AAP8QBY0_BRELA|nr:hypothetical protein C4A77_19035 [Brevibacillus laterosporus]
MKAPGFRPGHFQNYGPLGGYTSVQPSPSLVYKVPMFIDQMGMNTKSVGAPSKKPVTLLTW